MMTMTKKWVAHNLKKTIWMILVMTMTLKLKLGLTMTTMMRAGKSGDAQPRRSILLFRLVEVVICSMTELFMHRLPLFLCSASTNVRRMFAWRSLQPCHPLFARLEKEFTFSCLQKTRLTMSITLHKAESVGERAAQQPLTPNCCFRCLLASRRRQLNQFQLQAQELT